MAAPTTMAYTPQPVAMGFSSPAPQPNLVATQSMVTTPATTGFSSPAPAGTTKSGRNPKYGYDSSNNGIFKPSTCGDNKTWSQPKVWLRLQQQRDFQAQHLRGQQN